MHSSNSKVGVGGGRARHPTEASGHWSRSGEVVAEEMAQWPGRTADPAYTGHLHPYCCHRVLPTPAALLLRLLRHD